MSDQISDQIIANTKNRWGFGIRTVIIIVGAFSLFLASCALKTPVGPVGGKPGPGLTPVLHEMVGTIEEKRSLDRLHIQISPNNFWESGSRINFPFSSVLSDGLAAELSKAGAVITIQEIGEGPLKLTGSYIKAGSDLLVTVRLRRMGTEASRDLAVVRGRVPGTALDPKWFTFRFDRMGRTLVRLMESGYGGMSSLILATRPFESGDPALGDLVLGDEIKTHMTTAIASSHVFENAGTGTASANAELTGTYLRAGDRMVFQAEITALSTGKKVTGAAFEIPMADIPRELMAERIQTLDDLVANAAEHLVHDYGKNTGPEPVMIYLGKYSFPDTRTQAFIPISPVVAEKFRAELSASSLFQVTDDPSAPTSLLVSGKLMRRETGLTLAASIRQMKSTDSGISFSDLAVTSHTLGARYCKENWFHFDLQGKVHQMLDDMVKDSLGRLERESGSRVRILIHRFTWQGTQRYSRFSDTLNTRLMDYFSGSRFYVPVKNPEAQMARHKYQATRLTGVAQGPDAALAALADASCFIRGSFHPTQRGGLEIRAALVSVDGRILASADTVLPAYLTDRDLVVPAPGDTGETGPIAVESPAGIEIMTQKGRHNLFFQPGDRLDFFIRTTRDLYVAIFTRDARGNVFRIYPNRFTGPRPMIRSNRITAIPDHTYDSGFEFKVDPRGSLGKELVTAFASNQPLPHLPGRIDTGFYDMTRHNMDLSQIKAHFERHAASTGAFFAWDTLSITTRPR